MRRSGLAYLALAPCLGSTANARKRPCTGCPPTITTVPHAQIFDGQIAALAHTGFVRSVLLRSLLLPRQALGRCTRWCR